MVPATGLNVTLQVAQKLPNANTDGNGQAMSDNDVVVYYKAGCPFAARLRAGLKLARIPYSAVHFGDDEAAAAKVREVNGGNEISPTVRVGQKFLTNPSVREVRRIRASR